MSALPSSPVRSRSAWGDVARNTLRKTLWMLLVLWGITIISFWVIHLAPGSPTDMETTLNPLAGAAARQRLEALYGWTALCTCSTGTGWCACCTWISAIPCPPMAGPC